MKVKLSLCIWLIAVTLGGQFSVAWAQQDKTAKKNGKVTPQAMLKSFVGKFSGRLEQFSEEGELLKSVKTETVYTANKDGTVAWVSTETDDQGKTQSDSGSIKIKDGQLVLSSKSMPQAEFKGRIIDAKRIMWSIHVTGLHYSLLVKMTKSGKDTILHGQGVISQGGKFILLSSVEKKVS